MLSKQQRRQILMMGCLRDDTEFTKEEQLTYIKKGLKADIDEKILEKLFLSAVPGVRKYGILEYFLYYHNLMIMGLEKNIKNKERLEWCTVYPAQVVGKSDSKYIVKRIDDKTLETDSEAYPDIKVLNKNKIVANSYVILHRDKIRLILNEKEFETALRFYNKFKKEKH